MYGTYNCYECFITDTVRKESATIRAVFPSPNDVMSILVQVIVTKIFIYGAFGL